MGLAEEALYPPRQWEKAKSEPIALEIQFE